MNFGFTAKGIFVIALSATVNCLGVDPASVTVHLLQEQVIGETSELDRSKFFNVHSTYTGAGLTKDDLDQLQSLNVGFGRSFDGPFSGHKNGTPYPDSETIQEKSAEVIAKAKADPLFPYRTTRRIVTTEPKAAFNMESDPKEMARYAVDILEFNYEDDFRPDFFSPISIPFVAAGRYGDDQAVVRERMTDVIAEVGKEIDRRGLSTKVIGYTSAWPMPHYWDFGHWRSRMQMFMDRAGPHIDAICFLMMDSTQMKESDRWRSGSRVEAIMDLIETYGAQKWGEPKPFAISEYGDVSYDWPDGDTYSPARASAELNSYNHFLFSLLDREHRLLIAVPFITTKSPWFFKSPMNQWQPFSADLWRPDPESIIDGAPTRFLETEKMEFYRLWRDVNGNRVLTESTDPDIAAFSFVSGPDAFICLNNFEDNNRTVQLSLPGDLPDIDSVVIKRMYIPKQEAVLYTKNATKTIPEEMTMRPHETVVLHLKYKSPLDPQSAVKTTNHYSDSLLQPIRANEPITFNIDGVDFSQQPNGSLRVALAREHNLSKKPQLTLNGNAVEFPDDWMGYDQSNRKGGFFGTIRVPVPSEYIQTSNQIVLTFPDDGGRVSTVILDTTENQ
ncbi:MAG: hypothetical protein AAFX93_17045 [Verrucomicrobiota bacterium]